MGLRLSGVEAEWGQGLMGLRVWGFDGLGSFFLGGAGFEGFGFGSLGLRGSRVKG